MSYVLSSCGDSESLTNTKWKWSSFVRMYCILSKQTPISFEQFSKFTRALIECHYVPDCLCAPKQAQSHKTEAIHLAIEFGCFLCVDESTEATTKHPPIKPTLHSIPFSTYKTGEQKKKNTRLTKIKPVRIK